MWKTEQTVLLVESFKRHLDRYSCTVATSFVRFFLTDWKWGLERSVRHRQHIYIWWTRYRGSRKCKHCTRWALVPTLGRLRFWGCADDYFDRNWHRRTGRHFTGRGGKKFALKITVCPESNFFSLMRMGPETSCKSVLYSWIRL